MPDPVQFWHWWTLALVLGAVEMLAPGFWFLWFGVSAALVGAVLLVWPTPPLAWQAIAFAVFAFALIGVSRYVTRGDEIENDVRRLNRRGAQYVGQTAVLDEALVNGRGRIRLGDTVWPVVGADLPAGSTVRIVGVDGVALRVVAEAAGHR